MESGEERGHILPAPCYDLSSCTVGIPNTLVTSDYSYLGNVSKSINKHVMLALASKTGRAVQVPCDSGKYTTGGECCEECPPGEGVVKKCGATQTTCAQCLDSELRLLCEHI
ncbi:Tumor necrosis factor receptor superfamily member 16 [Liparis tanakae]|uniref:Tumor necrosis factor receptor superfamily member 16 n=1 Tax=Liparis tanakae TaxID=230148 RepID=A0A4Z2GBC1_9TELE|nr:Tumor necrosis factor receptor superfamily member 16 [Liparis tanakae]